MQVQRGISVFNSLLFDEPKAEPKTDFNGRDPALIEARDNYLLHRFYYKSRIQRKLYQDCLDELSKEVWLSKLQIQKIIQNKSELVLIIKKKQPSVKELKEAWPFISW